MNENINYGSMMYDENGSFIPQTGSHGNMSEKLAHLRNTYMEAEREYFECLLSDKSVRDEFLTLLEIHADNLFDYALTIQEQLEYGNLESEEEKSKMKSMSSEQRDAYHMQKLERAEGMMCLLFAAAKDKVRVLELIKLPEGRSR